MSQDEKRQASVLFDKSFYKKLEKVSKASGLSVAAWIRQLVITEINK